ncbi:MAG: hypothetical protein KatS3mg031_0384 [Chitinophagales bacterium]|nr:MAG: hypothetical protein KatS3mg031_0384 [Chitinophagales bacterium]
MGVAVFMTFFLCNSAAQESFLKRTIHRLETQFSYNRQELFLWVSVDRQMLYVLQGDSVVNSYPVSTSKLGTGNRSGSGKTPLGVHRIASKIGEGAPLNTIFIGRKNSAKLAMPLTEPIDMEEDWVTTRILWLDGLEPGINKGEGIDSRTRYIYIHGTPEEGLIGTPASHGCVRMRNHDVAELFEMVNTGTLVIIMNAPPMY